MLDESSLTDYEQQNAPRVLLMPARPITKGIIMGQKRLTRDPAGQFLRVLIRSLPVSISTLSRDRETDLIADRPYVQRALLSPVGNIDSILQSPVSPLANEHQRRASPSRSATSPMPRYRRPPSPDLSSNLDCAFPPWLPPSTPGRSSSPASRPGSRKGSTGNGSSRRAFTEPESFMDPKSPEVEKAVKMNRAQGPVVKGNTRKEPSLERAATFDQASSGWPLKGQWESPVVVEQRPATALPVQQALALNAVPDRSTSVPPAQAGGQGNVARTKGRFAPMRPQRPGGVDGFLVQLKEDTTKEAEPSLTPLRSTDRSNTFPVSTGLQTSNSTAELGRRPSEPACPSKRPVMPHLAISAPSNVKRNYQNVQTPAERAGIRNAPSPPRSTSQTGLRVDLGPGNTPPPMPSVSRVQQDYPKHAPSSSSSSTTSSHSGGENGSRSDSSPTISTTSSLSAISSGAEEQSLASSGTRLPSQKSHGRLRERVQTDSSPMPMVQEVRSWVPPARAYANLAQESPIPTEQPSYTTPRQQSSSSPPESPMDPALDRVFRKEQPQKPAQQSHLPPATQPDKLLSSSPPSQITPGQVRQRSADGAVRRPGTASKHVCRGCHEPIVGKSVKAADGRLTGRYHKQCFVCKTCQMTFATADFYVIDNHPYCEHHYHELNDSLCTGCKHGIEGQYLETQQSQKFHPRCLTCLTCREVLSDDYFEIGGKVYCERHAFAAVRSQSSLGPKRDMERRTTRLMMM